MIRIVGDDSWLWITYKWLWVDPGPTLIAIGSFAPQAITDVCSRWFTSSGAAPNEASSDFCVPPIVQEADEHVSRALARIIALINPNFDCSMSSESPSYHFTRFREYRLSSPKRIIDHKSIRNKKKLEVIIAPADWDWFCVSNRYSDKSPSLENKWLKRNHFAYKWRRIFGSESLLLSVKCGPDRLKIEWNSRVLLGSLSKGNRLFTSFANCLQVSLSVRPIESGDGLGAKITFAALQRRPTELRLIFIRNSKSDKPCNKSV